MCVIRRKDVYEGKDVDRALEIMEVLDIFYDKIKEDNTVYKNTEFIDTLKKVIYDQCNSGSCISIISSICKYFHKVGIVVEELIQQDLI